MSIRTFARLAGVAPVALVVLTALGCETSTGGTTSGAVTVDQFPAAFAGAMCKALNNCGGILYGDQANCLTVAMAEVNEGELTELVAAVKAGTLKFDSAQASTCLASVGTTCYFKLQGPPAGCEETFVGSAASGAACSDSEYCAAGFCSKPTTAPSSCPGKCAAFHKVGESCEKTGECERPATCRNGKCGTGVAKDGEPCGGNQDCGAASYCTYEGGGQTCKPKAAAGAKCDDGDGCQAGLDCQIKGTDGTCVARGKEGESCGGGLACADGLACATVGSSAQDAKQVCKPARKFGEACESAGQCPLADGTCKDGKCVAMASKGAACSPAAGLDPFVAATTKPGCMDPYLCDPTSKVCVDRPGVGQKCIDGKCAKGAWCDGGTCAAKPTAGQACADGYDCAKGLECDAGGKCIAPVCQ